MQLANTLHVDEWKKLYSCAVFLHYPETMMTFERVFHNFIIVIMHASIIHCACISGHLIRCFTSLRICYSMARKVEHGIHSFTKEAAVIVYCL